MPQAHGSAGSNPAGGNRPQSITAMHPACTREKRVQFLLGALVDMTNCM